MAVSSVFFFSLMDIFQPLWCTQQSTRVKSSLYHILEIGTCGFSQSLWKLPPSKLDVTLVVCNCAWLFLCLIQFTRWSSIFIPLSSLKLQFHFIWFLKF